MEFHAELFEIDGGSRRVGARLKRSSAPVASKKSPIESMQVVERNTSSRDVLFPQQDDAQTAGPQPGGDAALVKTRPCEDVPPIRSLTGAIALIRLRKDGLEKSILEMDGA